MIQIAQPFQNFVDKLSLPLDNGYVYIGAANQNPETNPIAAYWDAALTIPAAQPIRTINGYLARNGSPARLYAAASVYSITVRDSSGAIIITALDASTLDNLRADLAAGTGTTLLGHTPAGSGAVATTVKEELDNLRVSVFRWLTAAQIADVKTGTWYTGDVTAKRAAMYASLVAAEAYQRANKVSIEFPDGHYEIADNHMPWRNTGAGLLDYYNTALFCSPAVTFATVTPDGADVFQLNAIQNFSIFGFPKITCNLTGLSGSGSNGVSVTAGWDNLYLEVAPYNMPHVDAGAGTDGGKALTVQPATTANACGKLTAIVRAKGCAEGFGIDVNPVTMDSKATQINIDLVAEDCYMATKFSAGEATAALTLGKNSGIRIKAQAINCQRDIYLGRVRGIDIDMQVITTKTAAARRLSPSGAPWLVADTVVDSLYCTYAHNSKISVSGYKGECDYKAQVGAVVDATSGLVISTNECCIYLDIGGTAAIDNFNVKISGASSITNTVIYATPLTLTQFPAVAYTPSFFNTLIVGLQQRVVDMLVGGVLYFPYTNGIDSFQSIRRKGDGIALKSASASAGSTVSVEIEDHTGSRIFGVRNDGFMITAGRATAASVATVKQVMPIYDTANSVVGYVPIYTTYA